VTFYALDEHSKLDVRGKEFPRGAWTKTAPTEAKPRKTLARRACQFLPN
jgi:hypothetical protein